jgi:hypothetical protein
MDETITAMNVTIARVLCIVLAAAGGACGPRPVALTGGQGAEAMPSESVCPKSVVCTVEGKCSFDKATGFCTASTRADCEQSVKCKVGGACAPTTTGECAAGSVGDCKSCELCTKSRKRCIYDPLHNRCVDKCPMLRSLKNGVCI